MFFPISRTGTSVRYPGKIQMGLELQGYDSTRLTHMAPCLGPCRFPQAKALVLEAAATAEGRAGGHGSGSWGTQVSLELVIRERRVQKVKSSSECGSLRTREFKKEATRPRRIRGKASSPEVIGWEPAAHIWPVNVICLAHMIFFEL